MKISNEKYHHALALYIIARRKQVEVNILEKEMNDLLNEENGSHASDCIYTDGNQGTQEEFDEALKLMGIDVKNE